MRLLGVAARAAYSHWRNAQKLVRGHPLAEPSFASMTLDDDDVASARASLGDPASWGDDGVVGRYEGTFARWNGSRHAFAFLSGRAALGACLHALDLRAGDEVLVPGFTCVVVANAVRFAGLVPVFADIELETYGLDAERLERHVGPRTRAVLLHHLFGLVSRDYEAILEIARRRSLRTIEDCAHAAGASLHGRKVGTRADLAFFSSEQSKILNTIQGGVAVTDDDTLAARLRAVHAAAPLPDAPAIARQLRTVVLAHAQCKHPGRWWRGDLAELRWGASRIETTTPEEIAGRRPAHHGQRMPAPIAALGLVQLAKVDRYNERRRVAAARWDAWCDASGYARPRVVAGSMPVFLRYPVLVEPERKRDLAWARRSLGFTPGVWFVSHLHPAPVTVPACPNADTAVARCINLPTLLQ